MATEGYFILTKFLEFEPNRLIQFGVIPRTPLYRSTLLKMIQSTHSMLYKEGGLV